MHQLPKGQTSYLSQAAKIAMDGTRKDQEYLRTMMLPNLQRRPCVPPTAVVGGLSGRLTSAKFSESVTIDVLDILAKVSGASADRVPVYRNARDNNVAIWDAATYMIVHTHDLNSPVALMQTSTMLPSVLHPRSWVNIGYFSDFVFTTATQTPEGATDPFAFSSSSAMTFARPFVAGGHSDTRFPSGFQVRPIFAERIRGSTPKNQWFWVDAVEVNGSQQGATLNIATVINGTFTGTLPVGFESLQINTTFVLVQYQDGGNIETRYGGVGNAFISPDQSFSWLRTMDLSIPTSGYYTVRMEASYNCGGEEGLPPINDFSAMGQLTLHEYCAGGTAFICFSPAADLPSIADRYWLNGTSLLVSNENPTLQVAGRIRAIDFNATHHSNWFEATMLGGSEPFSRIPTDSQWNAGAGGPLIDGMYTWAKPTVYPTNFLMTSFDYNRTPNSTWPSHSPVLSYWPRDAAGFNGLSVTYISPSVSSGTTHCVLRLTLAAAISYVPTTQLIGTQPAMRLATADWEAMQDLLENVPNFSSNDWHSFYTGIANAIGKAADWIAGVGKKVAGVVAPVSTIGRAIADIIALF